MNTKTWFFLLIAFLFVQCKSNKTDKQTAIVNQTFLKIRQKAYSGFIDDLLSDKSLKGFNGAIIVGQGDRILYETYRGFSSEEGQLPLDSLSQFMIASVSKHITACLVLSEVDARRLNLDDLAANYVPEEYKGKLTNVRISHLLNHSSGYMGLKARNDFASGTGFSYSNPGYNLLGKIVEKTSQRPFDSLAYDLFQSCGMSQSSTYTAYRGSRLVNGYDGDPGSKLKAVKDFDRVKSDAIGIPAGGIISTPRDMLKWNQSLHHYRLLDSTSYKRMVEPSSLREKSIWGDEGYGFGIQNHQGSPKMYFHRGYIKGFAISNCYFPDSDVSLIVMENMANDSKKFPYIFQYQTKLKDFARINESALIAAYAELIAELEK